MSDLPFVKDVEVMDIDSDGNLDIIATYPSAISRNIRWGRNPQALSIFPQQTRVSSDLEGGIREECDSAVEMRPEVECA